MNKFILILLFGILIYGCSEKIMGPSPFEWQQGGSYEQYCLRCGRTNIISPIISMEAAPVVEWCIYDGYMCYNGYNISVKGSGIYFLDLDLINHCKECEMCRMYFFEPKEWYELTR